MITVGGKGVMDDVIDTDFSTRGFSFPMAYYLACASMVAYEEQSSGWRRRLGLRDNVAPFTCGQFHGFVAFTGKAALLAFRGTQSVGNCLTDVETMLASRAPYPGHVHAGFADAIEHVWPEVRRLLGSRCRAMPLWITGHSLGGAMATLASLRLARERYAVRAVYTYGSPRVGDRQFRDSYHLPNYRVVCGNDLVPHLPFRWCFKHVGHLKLLDHEGHLTEELAAWKRKKRSLADKAKHIQRAHRRVSEPHHDSIGFDWLADHRLDRYLEAIQKVLASVSHRGRLGKRGAAIRVGQHILQIAHSAAQPKPADRRQPPLSETEFVAAFFNQPNGLSRLLSDRGGHRETAKAA
jgi:triacylglycerol lipase